MASENIINVSEADFDYEVLKFSQNVPVVVDFWADWCRPCKTLSPMLEKIAHESGGTFRLARVDVDANPNLAILYNVRSIPNVKAFSNSQVVAEFTGLQPEERVREFIEKILPPSPQTLALEKADSLLSLHNWVEAEKIYRQILEQIPGQPASLLGLSKSLLAQNRVGEALTILGDFPVSGQYNMAARLLPLAEALEALSADDLPDTEELDAAFRTAIRLASRGNLPASLDGLLDILRQDKTYRDGKAHKVALSLLDLMGEDDAEARQYRAELANILF